MAKLTDNQEKFVQELIKGKSQREAYRTAYPKCKATDKTVDEMASKLYKTHKVYTRYNEIHDRLIKEAEDECIVTAKDVLRELKRIGFADINDFLSFRTEKQIAGIDDETGEQVIDYRRIIETKNSDEVDGRVVQEVSINSKGVFTFKLHDKMAALDKLGKHLGIFSERLNLSVEPSEKLADIIEQLK